MSEPAGRSQQDMEQIIERLITKAVKAGADAADAIVVEGLSLGASYRLGKLEDVDRSEGQDLGLRAIIGKQQASVSGNDFSSRALDELVERVTAMAKLAPEDPYCGLAGADKLAKTWPDLDLADDVEPSAESLSERAAEAEDAARAVPGVTNSNGAGAGWGRGRVVLATSEGFLGGYVSSSHSVSASVVAGEGTGMETDYDFATTRHLKDMPDAASIGRAAAERTVKRLGARKVDTQSVPIVYDPRVGRSILGHFAGAIMGPSIARKTSFLRERMNKAIFGEHINIIDDPHIKRGLASKPFDGEGVANGKTALVKDGVLCTWLLHSASARQLGLETTGHAGRGTGGPPGVTTSNLYMAPGAQSPEDMIKDIPNGFYVTELIGQGVSGVTGDYSRGAGGFWIENGELSFPVNEVTIASNLNDMFKNCTPANDLEFKFGTNVPTLRVDGMTVAGG